MPGRTRRRTGFALTDEQQTFLLEGDKGSNPFAGLTVVNTFGSMEAAKAAWERNRTRLTRGYGPGRPWAWWAFEAPPWKHLEHPPADLPPKILWADPNRIVPNNPLAVLKALGLPEQV